MRTDNTVDTPFLWKVQIAWLFVSQIAVKYYVCLGDWGSEEENCSVSLDVEVLYGMEK